MTSPLLQNDVPTFLDVINYGVTCGQVLLAISGRSFMQLANTSRLLMLEAF